MRSRFALVVVHDRLGTGRVIAYEVRVPSGTPNRVTRERVLNDTGLPADRAGVLVGRRGTPSVLSEFRISEVRSVNVSPFPLAEADRYVAVDRLGRAAVFVVCDDIGDGTRAVVSSGREGHLILDPATKAHSGPVRDWFDPIGAVVVHDGIVNGEMIGADRPTRGDDDILEISRASIEQVVRTFGDRTISLSPLTGP